MRNVDMCLKDGSIIKKPTRRETRKDNTPISECEKLQHSFLEANFALRYTNYNLSFLG